MPDPTVAAPNDTTDADRLLVIIEALTLHQEQILELLREKREAIRNADLDAMTRLCGLENELVQRIAALEKQRLALVGRFTERLAPDAPKPLVLSAIAASLDEAMRGRLETAAEALRAIVRTVRAESATVTAAAQALDHHLAGIVQTVLGVVSRVRVYERRGRIAAGVQMDHCVDLKS